MLLLECECQIRRGDQEWIGPHEVAAIGGRRGVGAFKAQVRKEINILRGFFLGVARVGAAPGNGEMVDYISVVRINDADGGLSALWQIQDIFVARVVDEPKIGDGKGLDATTTIRIDDIVDHECGGSVRRTVLFGAIAEVQDDAIAIGVFRTLVHFIGHDVVGDDVVKPRISVEPLVGVEGDATRPAVPLRHFRRRRHAAVVVNDVVVGGQVIAFDRADAGAARICDGVGDETKMVSATAEESIGGIALAIQIEPTEFEIGGPGRKLSTAQFEHGRSIRSTSPDKVNSATVAVLVDDPGGGFAACGRDEGGTQRVRARKEADHGARPARCGCAQKCFGGGRAVSRVLVIPGRGSIHGAIVGTRFAIHKLDGIKIFDDINQR